MLGVPDDDYIAWSVSLSYDDTSVPANGLVNEWEPAAAFATWHEG